MRISDWSSDVCSSDLLLPFAVGVEIVAVGVGIGKSDAVAEPPAGKGEIEPRIADEFLVPPHIVAVGVATAEFDPPAGISAAHLGADLAGKSQFGAPRDIAVAIAVALVPAERLGARQQAAGG